MKTTLTVKNFRVFDENGVTFELNPITILTGQNSSGKSSIVKALLLLDDYLSQIKKAIDNGDKIELDKYKIDFTKYPANTLGRFDKVVHDGSTNKKITIEYSTYSLMMSKDVDVKLVFTSDPNDDLNNGYLESITISTEDGVFYSSDKNNGRYCSLNIIKNECLDFIETEHIIHCFCGLSGEYAFDKIEKDEYKSKAKTLINYLKTLDKRHVKDVLRYIRTVNKRNSIINTLKVNPNIIGWTKENGSLFMIPLIDKLNELSKKEIKVYVKDELLKNASKGLVFATYKILDDFIKSDCGKFRDYFTQWENSWLDKKEISKFPKSKNNLCLLDNSDIDIYQEYVLFAPYNIVYRGRSFNIDDYESADEVHDNIKQEIENWEKKPVDFDMIYEVAMGLNAIYTSADNEYYQKHTDSWGFKSQFDHKMLEILTTFASDLVREVVLPDWVGNIEYVSSSRANVSKVYTMDTKDDFSELLKNYFEEKRKHMKRDVRGEFEKKYKVSSFVNEWIQKFEIGDSLSINTDEEGLGATIRLHKSKKDHKGRLLADEGYGITQLVSILLQIETAILAAKGEKINRFIDLEILDKYDADKFHYELRTIAIEEPEIHLHPRLQSFLADMFVEAYKKYNIHFIVETHSEYLIRKMQVLVASRGKNPDVQIGKNDIAIFYVNAPKDVAKGEHQVKRIYIGEDGRLNTSFGTGFFDEADDLAMEILRLKAQ